ncbi:MAG: serine/threonine protein kinase, partial [bacterium]|nr:serine/threonine protein kinase [bacterium]
MMSDTEPKYKQADFRLCPQCDKLHTGLTTCPSCSGPLQLIEYSFFIGKTLGKYTIEKVVGVGGMGVVFLALHKTLAKKVALKIFIPRPGDETFEKRFLREARILAGLRHPNIVEVHDFDVSQWGMPYYVMEYLEGQTLGAAIKEHPKGLPPPLIYAYLGPVIQALSHAHKRGVIHRDLKPENIFIENFQGKEVVKILDFGIAKTLGGDREAGNLTATETVLGTPFYLAPEQILSKDIGPHTDQYALALIAAEMFSGKAVRGGKNIGEILYTVVHEAGQLEDAILKEIPAKTGQSLLKATMLDTGERFADIDSFGAAVLEALGPEPASRTTIYETPAAGRTGAAAVAKHPSRKTFVSIEEEARRQAGKKLLLRWAVPAAMLLLVVVILLLLDPFGFRSGEPGADDAQTAPKAFLTLIKSVKAPKGITGILTYQGDTLVLQDPGSVYLMDMKKNAAPERFPWEEKILRGLPGGNVVLKANYSITSRNAVTGDDELIARNPPPGEAF